MKKKRCRQDCSHYFVCKIFDGHSLDAENCSYFGSNKELEAVKLENKHLKSCAQMAIEAGRSLIGVKKILEELLKGGKNG